MSEFLKQFSESIWLHIVVVIKEITIFKKSNNIIKADCLNFVLFDLLINLLQHQFLVCPKILHFFLVFLSLHLLLFIENIMIIVNQILVILKPSFCGGLPFGNLKLWFFWPTFSRYFLFQHNSLGKICAFSALYVLTLVNEMLDFFFFFSLLFLVSMMSEF